MIVVVRKEVVTNRHTLRGNGTLNRIGKVEWDRERLQSVTRAHATITSNARALSQTTGWCLVAFYPEYHRARPGVVGRGEGVWAIPHRIPRGHHWLNPPSRSFGRKQTGAKSRPATAGVRGSDASHRATYIHQSLLTRDCISTVVARHTGNSALGPTSHCANCIAADWHSGLAGGVRSDLL